MLMYFFKISRLPNGLTVASVDLGGPITQLVVAYRAGTRYEMPDEAGLVHQIRNCIGGDSQRYYGAQLLWQCGSAGANVVSLTNTYEKIFIGHTHLRWSLDEGKTLF